MVYEERETARLPAAPDGPGRQDAVADTTPLAATPESARAKKFVFARELIETILLTLVIFVAVRTLIVNFQVDGDSMRPSLQDGQYLLVNKAVYFHFDLNALKNLGPDQDRPGRDVVYLFHPPERGDIVVFEPPVRSDKPYVKRVIALPGETVTLREGKLYVNGNGLDEGYIAAPPSYPCPFISGGSCELVVPNGHVFVLGDNRNNSSDSHVFGPVPLNNIIGKAIVSYWPPGDIGLIPHERYAQADGTE